MNNSAKVVPLRMLVSLALVIILLAGLAAHGYAAGWHSGAQSLSDSEIASLVGGGSPGACGIVVGIGLGVLALGASALTMGIGGALLISVALHAAAYACVS